MVRGPVFPKLYPETKYLMILLVRKTDFLFRETREEIIETINFIGSEVGKLAGILLPEERNIENNLDKVLKKNWGKNHNVVSDSHPGILIFEADSFDEFDPNIDPWGVIRLQDLYTESGKLHQGKCRNFTRYFIACIKEDRDIFYYIAESAKSRKIEQLGNCFEIKPGIFGFSFNIGEFIKAFG